MGTEQAASLVTRVLASTGQAVHAPWAPQPSQGTGRRPGSPGSACVSPLLGAHLYS